MTTVWKQATAILACARDPRCRGIQADEFYYEQDDGRAIHAVGFCRDRNGDRLPAFPWEEGHVQPLDVTALILDLQSS